MMLSFWLSATVLNNDDILMNTNQTCTINIETNLINGLGTSYDIWFNQILKKLWKSQYLGGLGGIWWYLDLQIVIPKVFGIFWFANSHFKSIWKNLDLVFIGSRKPNNISKFLPWISDRLITLRLKIHVLKTI